jgi:putative acetyltransferase
MKVRDVEPADHAAIASLVHDAFMAEFGRADEHELVERVRGAGDVVLERVAEDESGLVGHILFSRAWVADAPVVQMAPVSARVGRQGKGIGAALIRDGLAHLQLSETHVFVLGHPAYYPRFGFSAAAAAVFESPWPGPHFMLRHFGGGPSAGRLRISPAFGA